MKNQDRLVIKDIYTKEEKKKSDDLFFSQHRQGKSLKLEDILSGKHEIRKHA